MVLKPEAKAVKILRMLRINTPEDLKVKDIAWMCGGILVRDETLEGAEARLVKEKDRSIITLRKDIREPGRRRFGIAHEIGHFELNTNKDRMNVCVEGDLQAGSERIRFEDDDDDEYDANVFAASLLMPDFLFGPLCVGENPSMRIIDALADTFRTTLTATALRYIKFSKERCAIVYSESGHIRWFQGTDDFGHWIPVRTKLNPLSLAFDFFDGKELPARMESVDASTWLEGKYVSDAMIKEESRALPYYNAVLTLLWIDKDIDIDEDDWDDSETFTPDGRYRRRD